jgi:hypothetical protein
MKRKWIGIILAIVVTLSIVSDGIVAGQDDIKDGYTLIGDTVSTSVANGEVKVTPATLTDSGWVTVEYYSKQLTGSVDVSFGFDGKYDIKPSKVESWESYTHNLTRYVPGVAEGVFPQPMGGLPTKIISVKELKVGDVEKVDIGDLELNPYVAAINYDTSVPIPPSGGTVNTDAIISYTTYDEKTGSFTYKYNGQVIESYQETYVDWKSSANVASKTSDVLSGASDWKSLKIPETVKLNAWHKMRFWVDMPFGGLNKVEGKYNVVIKPTGMSLSDAKLQGKLILLDPWYSYSWNYRKSIVIAHTDDGAQTNYQMKLLVGESSGAVGEQVDCGAKVASDFDDLRFTTSNGTTLCDYWIESLSGTTPNQLATVWIEIPSIAAHPDDTTIYMYYGGTTTAVSNGADTFLFFDDFPGVSLDGTKWSSWGTITVASSGATIASNSGIYRNAASATNQRTRAKVKETTYVAYDQFIIFYTDSNNYAYMNSDNPNNYYGSIKAGSGSWADSGLARNTSYHIFQMLRNGTTSILYSIDGAYAATINTNVYTGTAPLQHQTQTGGVIVVDWSFVALYTANEPTWSSFGSESTKGRSFGVIIGSDTSKSSLEIAMCRNELWIS